MQIETQNTATKTEQKANITSAAITLDTPMPKGLLLNAIRDNVGHVFQPEGPIHQFVKNSINSYPSVGDLMPRLA